MARLSFDIRPSVATTDHQARPLVDEDDPVGPVSLGLDPPDLIAQLCPPKPGITRIGRCSCGVIGCGDVVVDVRFAAGQVIWQRAEREIPFARDAYLAALHRLQTDHGWEDLSRRTERLVTDQLKRDPRWQSPGTHLDWVSTRIAHMRLHVSLHEYGTQRLLMTAWDGASEATAVAAVQKLLDKTYGRS